jgi:eukaryotic-like serine/threonine-protein kinase
MNLNTGARLGPYEIVGRIGAGGMGEVYKAWDTRLDRAVAIKVLPFEFASDPDRRARFEREARAVAALNHPHICNLHDIGDAPNPEAAAPSAEPVRFLVMEYLEGQTLSDRLRRGALPPADVWRYAIELAGALDHAHRRGLVHRDLKPGNVMLTTSGAKLLDFGLSRLQTNRDVPALSTVTPGQAPLTAAGAVLGTFPYMSPEQLAGREADARSDIFAFGALVYEMATGRRAFEGAASATVIGAVLHLDPPPVSSVQPVLPPALDRLVSRCLAKDPDDRWQTARDLELELIWIADHARVSEEQAAPRRKTNLVLAAAVALSIAVAVAAAFIVVSQRRTSAAAPPASLAFVPPDGVTLADVTAGGSVAISPDGSRLAFVGADGSGRRLLWIRRMDSFAAQAVPASDGAQYPFWSPDSRFVAFFARRKLRKVPVAGGLPQVLCDMIQPRGGAWSGDDVIVFADGAGHFLSRVTASGGVATPIGADGLNVERYFPAFLPDGRHYVYFGRPQKHGIYLATLDSPGARLLLPDYSAVAYSRPDYLVALITPAKGASAGTLIAHRFDSTRLQLVGEAQPVAEPVGYSSFSGRGDFSVSAIGTLVFGNPKRKSTQLAWFDRTGNRLQTLGGVDYDRPSLSPDEKTVAAAHIDSDTRDQNLWLITTRDVASPLTSFGNLNFHPVWSPDGTSIVFAGTRDSPPNLVRKIAKGAAGAEEVLIKSPSNDQPTDWSPDGKFIIYGSLDPKTQWDLWLLPMSVPQPERKPVPFLRTADNEHLGRFSPDGRWLAYVSDESGSDEVYIVSFPGAGTKQRISTGGGSDPRWRGDGRELFYNTVDGRLMKVGIRSEVDVEATAPVALFTATSGTTDNAATFGTESSYDVARDGQRFLISTIVEQSNPIAKIVLNWPAALLR